MPQALPLTTKISQGVRRNRKNYVNTAEFEGYEQTVAVAMNPNRDEWFVPYIPLDATDRATVWAALDAVGVTDYFTWQPPGAGSTLRFKVVRDSINEEPVSGDLYNISFQLRQTF